MNIKDAITQAIGAHGIWKARLRTAIQTRRLDVPVSVIKSDSACDLGRWLLELKSAPEQAGNHAQTVRLLHAKFHVVAAHAAELAIRGNGRAAEQFIVEGGEFAQASSELTLALRAWRKSLE